MFESLFRSVLTMSAGASVVIMIVLLLRLVLKKAPRRYSYILWALVILRLACPVFPESSLSVMPGDMDVAAVFDEFTVDQNTDRFQIDSPAADTPADIPDDDLQLPVKNDPVPSVTTQIRQPDQSVGQELPTIALPQTPQVQEQPPVTKLPLNGWEIGSIVWLAGIWIMAFYGVWSLFRLKSRLVGSMDMGGGVYLADHIETPFVMGFFRPKVYLPSYLKAEEAEYIVLHERHHIRRFDHVVKLVFFGTLCVHWFNPLVWLAFVLMGHDMEMSCDEAVMEKLQQDVRSDYASSLLQLSTGRRKIAPTPLAFGEGDPKGRIKNVLNYRKPRFWIVVAAVTVCVIAAVCLLTNPVKKDREYLNYPGLEWGMSPEEVKTALELTDEHIIMDEGETPDDEFSWSDPPRYVIAVKGLTCFGEETTLARFLFYDYSLTCQNFALETVELYYPDENSADPVDMKKLQKSISRYYGDPVEQLQRYEEGMPGTDPKIKTEDVPEGYAYWLSKENLDSYLSQEQKDVIYGLYESANKDKETFIANRELYDLRHQATWLVTAFCNDHYGPSDGFPDDMAEEGFTNNFVRISANSMHTVDAYLQYAENGVLPEAMEPTQPREYDGMLNYPGLSWGMKLDEVVTAMGKNTADFTKIQEEGREGKSYQLSGVAISEYIDLTMDMTFRFSAAGGLNGVRIVLPNEPMAGDEPVALSELESILQNHYGNSAHNYGYYPAPGAKGISEEYDLDLRAWLSAQTLAEAFPEETLDAYRKAYFADASDKDWDAYITHKRLVTVKTTADEAKFLLKQESSGDPVAVAVFDAEEYVTILENVVQEGPDPLLNYPGLQWGMTPDQVKLTLRLRDEQIKSESESEEGTDYTINVTDLECFGEKVNLAVFRFSDGTKLGGPYGLYDIMLFYPDQQCANPVDMEKIVAAVTACYGEPAQEIVQKDSGLNISTMPVPEGQYYWHSELDLDAYMTEEQKELLYLDSIHKLVDKADGDREFADKRWKQNWLSQIWVMDDYLRDLEVDREDGPTDYCVNIYTSKTWVDSQIRELTARNGFGPYLQHPYLTWGMDPDIVLVNFDYMGWTVDSDELEQGDGFKRTMELSGQDYFGHSVKKLVLEFVGEKETNLKLSFVRVVLDSNASASDIWGELKTRYGTEPEKYWDCSLVDGKYTEQVHKPATAVSVWPSFGSLKTRYSDGVLNAQRALYESENGVKVSDADWAKYAENRYLVSLMFGVNGKANPNREAEGSDCIVIDYDASELIAYDAKVAKIRQSYDAARLNYPGLEWGMTPAEVQEALGYSDDNVEIVDGGQVLRYQVKGLNYLGLPTDLVQLNFTSFKGSQWGLYGVEVILPDATDMEKANQAVAAYYGDPIDSYTYTRIDDGKPVTEKSEENAVLWLSQSTIGNTFSQAEQEYYWQFYEENYSDMLPELTVEGFMEGLQTTPLGRIMVTDNMYGEVYNDWNPNLDQIKCVHYDSNVTDFEQFFDYHRKQVEQLNYPGLDWGMTMEEVQSALGFGDDAITSVEEREINVTSYFVENLDYFGIPTDGILFSFSSLAMLEDGERGLYEVIVLLPDDTDMEIAKQAVTAYYGEPIDSYTYTHDNGISVTERSEKGNDLWLSKATAGNTFSEAELEFYWQFLEEMYDLLPDVTKDRLMESLHTTPLVSMNLTDDLYRKVYHFGNSDFERIKAVRYNTNVYHMEQFLAIHADEIG